MSYLNTTIKEISNAEYHLRVIKQAIPRVTNRCIYDVIIDGPTKNDESVFALWTKQEAMLHFNHLKNKYFPKVKT